jgi:hypothetical protein
MAYQQRGATSVDWLAIWILVSAWCSFSGWILAAVGWLTPLAVGLSSVLFACGLFFFRKLLSMVFTGKGLSPLRLLRSRWFIPKIWMALAAAALIGGILYHPTNYDYLTYRFPRVLYWCGEHRWYWIPTIGQRMNYSGTGFEWLMVPLILLFKTDRLFFLINFIAYLLLPGLIFSVLSGLGVSKRISWWWMWILPCGYCYILQAASAGNDSFAAIYCLASLHYLFRARNSCSIRNLALSCLAIALLTGAKASNLPLVLPWLIAAFFNRACFLEKLRSPILFSTFLIAIVVSFLPVALLNIHFTGDYSGDPNNRGQMKLSNPVIGLLGNSLQLAVGNLAPPLWPRPMSWESVLPTSMRETLHGGFPRIELSWGEMQMEEDAGVGPGIVALVIWMLFLGFKAHLAAPGFIKIRDRQSLWIVGGAIIALLAYMAKMGSESAPRLVAAYYPLLIAGILVVVSLDGRIVHRVFFRWIGVIAMLSAFVPVILSPARPLFPAMTISRFMTRGAVPTALVERYNKVYTVYASRPNAFAPLLQEVPNSEEALGILPGGNDPIASIWRPFGKRKITDLAPKDSIEKIKGKGIHYVIVSEDLLSPNHLNISDLEEKWSAHLISEKSLTLRIQRGPQVWYLLSL